MTNRIHLNSLPRMRKPPYVTMLLLFTLSTACSQTTTRGDVGVERRQLLLLPSSQINRTSAEAYAEMKTEAAGRHELDADPAMVARVQQISRRLIPVTASFRPDAVKWEWEAHVVRSDDLNAFCMPGGKIIFYSGLITRLKLGDAEIAAIMGHEIAHALREHGRERMSEALIEQGGLTLLNATGVVDPRLTPVLQSITQVMINLPHGRGQESEADTIGLELMARAGYDPRSAVGLWKKMAATGGKHPPEILSTHPADQTRIAGIEKHLPQVIPLYEATIH